ncbi:MAG: hypothetical protein OXH39_18075 [Candidatus Poribacteria bacterium]|nr:hypothetical protein [Candidatus Poribacteria bacterium]
MKRNIACLLLAAVSIIILPLLFAQQDQNSQGPDPEIAALKKRILELENKLQTVENIEKMELAAKLADAQARLANAEFGKLERDLRDSNHKWLTGWILFFLAIIAAVGRALWLQFKSKSDQLIADEVEKNLDGFKGAMAQVNTLQNQLTEASAQVNTLQNQIRVLEREHAASVLENFMNTTFDGFAPQSIEALGEEILLQVFGDEKYRLPIRAKAVEVLAARKSPRLVSPVLEFLNSIVDSDFDWQTSIDGERLPFRFLNSVGQIHTNEAHQGLKKFLNRLLTENPKHKDLFLTWTAYYLIYIDVKLGMDDSVSIIKKVILNLDNSQQLPHVVGGLVEYFNTFNEPEGIKEILTNDLTDGMPDVETQCLELLQNHDPDFVKEWQVRKTAADSENEASS